MRPSPTQQSSVPESSDPWGRWFVAGGRREATAMSPCQLARIAKGLAHPARVAIVRRLAHGRQAIASDIVRDSGLAQSTVSEHLRVLRDAGIVSSRKEGSRVWYQLRSAVLEQLALTLEDLVDD